MLPGEASSEETYKNSGSHGCINVSLSAVEELYGMIEKDTPVVAYYREKVELASVSADISNAYSYVEPVEEEPETTPAADAGTATDGAEGGVAQ